MPKPTAIVYVDGFNLYYRALRGTSYKWLDLEALFDHLLPQYEVTKIYYFTADIRAKANPNDPTAPDRQKAYLNALGSLPRVEVIKGNFLVMPSRGRLIVPPRVLGFIPVPKGIQNSTWLPIWKVEEKGSDVSLGAHLVRDAALKRADLHVVVTSDSDLAPTLQMVTGELGREVALCLPAGISSKRMERCKPKFMIWLSKGALLQSQFPPAVTYRGRTYHRPMGWDKKITPR